MRPALRNRSISSLHTVCALKLYTQPPTRLAQTECFRNAGPRLRAAFFRVFFYCQERKKKGGLPVASGIAKPLDIVATHCLRLETIYAAADAAGANRVFPQCRPVPSRRLFSRFFIARKGKKRRTPSCVRHCETARYVAPIAKARELRYSV